MIIKVINSITTDLRTYLNYKNCSSISMAKLPEEKKVNLLKIFETIELNPYNNYGEVLKIMKEKFFTNLMSGLIEKDKHTPIHFLQNLPIDKNMIITPSSDKTPDDKEVTSELSLLLLSSLLEASPYINKDEKSNSIIQNVIPIPGKELELSGSGSLKTFNWHTENVHEENPADYLMLLSLRGDKNAYTSFMLLDDIIKDLPKDMLENLLTTNFSMKTGPSYLKEMSIVRPILTQNLDKTYNIYYNSDKTRCIHLDEKGQNLYESFSDYLGNVPSYAVSLRPGEAVIIDNKHALHKRDGFEISTTIEESRWLQRIYLKKLNSKDYTEESYDDRYNGDFKNLENHTDNLFFEFLSVNYNNTVDSLFEYC